MVEFVENIELNFPLKAKKCYRLTYWDGILSTPFWTRGDLVHG